MLLPPEKESWLTHLGEDGIRAFLRANRPDHQVRDLAENWVYKLRREQFEPETFSNGEADCWYINSGRGWGKTATGSFTVNRRVLKGQIKRPALVAPTAADARDVMVEGPTGLLATAPPGFLPKYEPSLRRVTWPNGAQGILFSAEEPERLRGPQHDFGWLEELAAWKRLSETLDMFQFGLRLGDRPQFMVTTTPKPFKRLKELRTAKTTVVTRGATYDNYALPPATLRALRERYEGTRLGQQELYAEELGEAERALWTRDLLDDTRRKVKDAPDMIRVVVALDPSLTNTEQSDEMGLIVAGLGDNHHGYVMEDLSARMSPGDAAQRCVDAYHLHDANAVVAEINSGGDWVKHAVRGVDATVPFIGVRAKRGKYARAEPVSAMYEQKRCHHLGYFPDLEDELCSWEPDSGLPSPNRLDACVWAFTELMLAASTARALKLKGF